MANARAQTGLFDMLYVDNFAGGGGASTGIELATGRPVDIAINHDPAAILMHKTNHPYTEHFCESVWDIDPVKVCRGRPVGLAWFSPDCKHFSKAKGSALVDRNIRGLAWVVLRWAATVRPRVIILENVEEFQTWGPVRKGRPVKSKAGTTFQKWKSQLLRLGYTVEHRELVAADYGAPTIRKRFVLIARCDGQPVRWPKPTHSRDGGGGLKKWVSAAEIIDWTQPCYSIFATKKEIKEKYGVNAVRPLADNTLRRVIRGVDKFTIKSGRPFLVNRAFTFNNTGNSTGAPVSEPVPVVRASAGVFLSAASLIQYHTEQAAADARVQGLGAPVSTVDASNRYGLTAANLVEYYGNGNPLNLEEPMHTATGKDREALVSAHICKFYGGVVGTDAGQPVPTVTKVDHNAVAASHLAEFKVRDIGQAVTKPLRTVTASAGEFAECRTVLAKADGRDLQHWPEVRALLNRFCDYRLTADDVLLLMIDGTAYYIADILLRMLTPRELYRAMGFPPDYIIDRDYTGKPYPKSAQVARCGNAVCPPMAAAVVSANLPECERRPVLRTMRGVMEEVAI